MILFFFKQFLFFFLVFMLCNTCHRNNTVMITHFHNGYTLSSTAHCRNFRYFNADDNPLFGDCHNFFIVFYYQCAYDFTISSTWTNGEYTFTAASTSSAGIESSGGLTISGDSTLVQMNLDNNGLTGPVVLQGGTLVMGTGNALGTGGLYFNGGTLRYGSGLNPDLSARVQAGSTSQVRVDTNGNTVSWNSATGVPQSLQLGIVGEITGYDPDAVVGEKFGGNGIGKAGNGNHFLIGSGLVDGVLSQKT
jgi:hypothetical protein